MNIEPTLVTLEDGRIGMHLRLGQFTATMPLPDEMASYTAEELKPFFARYVPEMVETLIKMKKEDEKKQRQRAKKELS